MTSDQRAASVSRHLWLMIGVPVAVAVVAGAIIALGTRSPDAPRPDGTTATTILSDTAEVVAYPMAEMSVDGDLSEWTGREGITFESVIFEHPDIGETIDRLGSNNDGYVFIAWNDRAFLIGARVIDDVHSQPYTRANIWHGDAVNVNIGFGGSGELATSRPDGDDLQVTLSPGDPDGLRSPSAAIFRGDARIFTDARWGNADVAAVLTDEGYTLEARIPWESMFLDSPPSDRFLAFLVANFDNDGEYGEYLEGERGFLQTVVLANKADSGFQVPDTWGTLFLSN